MAGKKRRSNKIREANFKKYEAANTAEKNAKRKKANAEKKNYIRELSRNERDMLIEEVMTKYSIKTKYALKRIIGTLNESRVRALSDGTIVSKEWFKSRKRTVVVSKIISDTKLPSSITSVMSH